MSAVCYNWQDPGNFTKGDPVGTRDLTPREIDVLVAFAVHRDKTAAQVGERLGIAADTVQKHLDSIRMKRTNPKLMLTNRELEMLELLAAGCNQKQIAERLGISYHTVRSKFGAIYTKLGVRSATAALSESYRRGLLAPTLPDHPQPQNSSHGDHQP